MYKEDRVRRRGVKDKGVVAPRGYEKKLWASLADSREAKSRRRIGLGGDGHSVGPQLEGRGSLGG